MWNEIKNDKWKSIVIVVAIIVFVVGIVVTAVNTGDTYATESEKCYFCTGSPSEYVWSLGTPSTTCNGGSWSEITSATSEATCKAPVVYTIVFDSAGGNDIANKYVTEGHSFEMPTPSKSGYTFKYWKNTSNSAQYTAGQSVTPSTSMSFIAVWENTYSCYFCTGVSAYEWSLDAPTSTCNGGTWSIVSKTEAQCTYSCYFCTGVPEYVWVFGGEITTTCTGGSWTKIEKSEETCRAPLTYTITFDSNGGNDIANKYVTEGQSFEMPTPSRSGYTFQYWRDTFRGIQYIAGQSVIPESSMDLVAAWKENATSPGTDDSSGDSGNTDDNSSNENDSVTTTPETYTISYDANGGSGAPASQTKSEGTDLKLSTTKPTRTGYTFVSWNTSKDGKGTSYNSGATYSVDTGATLYAQWKANQYKISYELNGGSVTGNPTSGTYNQEITIKNPTKTVNIIGNANKTKATIGKNISVMQKFAGWTSTNIDTKNAYYGSTAWTNGSTKVTDTKFKNLSITDGATVTLVANWLDASTTLPTVTRDGYTCKWNTKSDGKGTSYNSGAKYTISGNSSSSINLYAICEVNSKTDEEITTNNKTGDALIYTVYVVGLGSLGYAVYYFMKRKNNI